MQRDMDLIRTLLLKLEDHHNGTAVLMISYGEGPFQIEGKSAKDVAYHYGLLIEAGFVVGAPSNRGASFTAITWAGHDFLDSVRDEDIWRRTKEGVNLAGGFTFDLMKALAKGYVKTKLETLTGMPIPL